MKSASRSHYITGLKGILCILIMVGHFFGLYKYAQQFQPGFPILDAFLSSRIAFILDEGYWLYLFFLISGYLVAKSHFRTVSDVVLKSVNRFFRLGFPILFAYLVIYLMYVLIGFQNGETASLFQCDWYQNYYAESYSFTDVLRSPFDVLFLNKRILNAPYWVLREMFIASILIYALKYFYLSLSPKHEAICFSALMIITFICSCISPVITSCLMGMLISIYEKETGLLDKSYFAFWTILMTMPLYVLSRTYTALIFFAALLICVPKVKSMERVLSATPFRFLGQISWGIYSFHWPLICSAGAMFMIRLEPKIGLLKSYVISCILTSLITLLLSVVFYFTFERFSTYLTNAIDRYVKQSTQRLRTQKNNHSHNFEH